MIFTQGEAEKGRHEQNSAQAGVAEDLAHGRVKWLPFEEGDLREDLHAVPPDGVLVVGPSAVV